MSQIKGVVGGVSVAKNGIMIGGKWYDCTPQVAKFAADKLKGQEVEVTQTSDNNGKLVVERVKSSGGYQQNNNSNSGGNKSYSGKGKSGGSGYNNNNVGMQVGNALNNATALVVARDGGNASVEGVVEVAKQILSASEQLAALVKSGGLKTTSQPKQQSAPQQNFQDDAGDSGFTDDTGGDDGFDDNIPF